MGCTSRLIKTTTMEPIKITDKLTLRQEALRMAVAQAGIGVTAEWILKYAKGFELYLQGSAELPEYVDTSRMFADVMEKMTTNGIPTILTNGNIKDSKDCASSTNPKTYTTP